MKTRRKNAPNNIRALREQKIPCWRQQDLANRVGCSKSEICKYENGTRIPSVLMCMKIAQALGRPTEEVFWGLRDASLNQLAQTTPKEQTGVAV